MGCLLHFIGHNANVDQLVKLSPVEPCTIFERGERRSTRPNSRPPVTSGINLEVSEADFERFEEQLADALVFLRLHLPALKQLRNTSGVEHASLDFGIAMRNVIVQSDSFPAELLALLAQFDCGLVITQFPVGKKSKNLRRYRKAFRRAAI
jgi:hypothetical protein